MAVVSLTIAICVSFGLVGCGKSKPEAKSPAKTEDRWTAVRLVDGAEYFGKLVRVNDQFSALNDAYFMTVAAPETGGAGRIKRFGGEIHRPAAQILFPVNAVLYEQPLTSKSAAVKAIRDFESKNTTLTAPAKPKVPSGELLCVVLRNGEVFFGTVDVVEDVAVVTNAHYLRFKDEGAASSGEIRSLSQLVLVPQRTSSLGPSGEMRIPLSSVLYFQALSKDSPVDKAMK